MGTERNITKEPSLCYSFSPENLEISRKVLIFAVETMNEYGQTGI